uniref:Signal-induced proliferation-associated 1 n=1 Tax=Sphenodon punctatus TaxID=8508 RepID=A0A8D0GSQ6_SPHPU
CPQWGGGGVGSDDLFVRKLRRHASRLPLSSISFDAFRLPRTEAGSEGRPGGHAGRSHFISTAPPRARAHSHEEARAGSPAARRFRDPLLLLGLAAEDGDPVCPPPPEVPTRPWVRPLAHYDVQSILFDPTAVAGGEAGKQHNEPASYPGNLEQGQGTPLVLSCPFFRVEAGGESEWGLGRPVRCLGAYHCPNAAVSVLEEPRESYGQRSSRATHAIEYADLGACYYRKHFYGKGERALGWVLGQLALGCRKAAAPAATAGGTLRTRTAGLRTLRGSILEEALPPPARHSSPRGVAPKKLLEHILPELSLQCLRLASSSPKVPETLLKLDEQGLSFQRKVGVLYCRAGQASEEEMYNNESAGPAFHEFLQLLGQRVRLGSHRETGRADSTGTHSLYSTYQDYEIMFHVSTMLPYMPNNLQQLLRKRHIGNDIVTIVFQEPGALPFTPRTIRSHFQHVFIVVRVREPCTERAAYSVALSCTKDIPLFGPFLPAQHSFAPGPPFRDFLLAKAINAENAAERSGKFHAMATRTRQEYLRDLALNHVTTSSLEASSSRLALMALGSKKRERAKGSKGAEAHSGGALVWSVHAWNGSQGPEPGAPELRCLLGISAEFLVLIDAHERRVVFNCSCRDVLAWTFSDTTLDLYYETGDYVCMRLGEGQATEVVTRGCETRELTLLRNGLGQLGFQLDAEGFVTEVERFTFAEKAGLQPGARLVRICEKSLSGLSQAQTQELLRLAKKVTVTVVPPDENGKPRRSFSELYQKSLQEKRKSEPVSEEPAQLGSNRAFKPATLQLLRSLSLQDGPPHSLAEERTEFLLLWVSPPPRSACEEIPVLPNPTPDLILAATPKVPPEQDVVSVTAWLRVGTGEAQHRGSSSSSHVSQVGGSLGRGKAASWWRTCKRSGGLVAQGLLQR